MGSLAGITFAIAAITGATRIPFFFRHRWLLTHRRITALIAIIVWAITASVLADYPWFTDHIGGAFMVTVVVGAVAFSIRTSQESETLLLAQEEAANRDIFNTYEDAHENSYDNNGAIQGETENSTNGTSEKTGKN
jgi:hypothetical protein